MNHNFNEPVGVINNEASSKGKPNDLFLTNQDKHTVSEELIEILTKIHWDLNEMIKMEHERNRLLKIINNAVMRNK